MQLNTVTSQDINNVKSILQVVKVEVELLKHPHVSKTALQILGIQVVRLSRYSSDILLNTYSPALLMWLAC